MASKPPPIGGKYGRLIILSDEGFLLRGCQRLVRTRCDCGNIQTQAWYKIKCGRIKSCGCVRRTGRITHGDSSGKINGKRRIATEYTIWQGIKDRCHNVNSKQYADYGGRGITVCDEWRNSYQSFLSYVGRRPSRSLSLDRIDNDGGYKPGNVRWATAKTQMRNRRQSCQICGHDEHRAKICPLRYAVDPVDAA